MKRRGLQLSRRHRATLFAVSAVLLITGALWARLHQLDENAPASEGLRRVNRWLMEMHGLTAVGFVLLLGTLLPGHVRRAWRARKNRGNGAFFLTAVASLTISGYALYYLGDENWRRAASWFHLWLGVAAPLLLFWHIRSGRQITR
jgi:hypothetical protein